jgi:hypothetical protein
MGEARRRKLASASAQIGLLPFTIGLNADGKPVQRPLGEMTATEVLTALDWQAATVARLETEANPAHWLAEPDQIDGVALDAARQAVTTLRSLASEQERLIELLQLVGAAMPQWRRDSDLQLSAAVRRFWPR